MEISIDLGAIPSFNSSHCARLDNEQLKNLNVRKYPVLSAFIDKMGKLSADAQKLQRVLTSYNKIIEDRNQVLYVLWEPGHKPNQSFVVGFLKIGRRNLYLYDDKMQSYQDSPICLLDFYVHYGLQRKGYGKILYDVMLKEENAAPHTVAIDKPSDNLLFFLKKHYGLINPCWQSTNYVVYPKFFEANDKKSVTSSTTNATPLSTNGAVLDVAPPMATAVGQHVTSATSMVTSGQQHQQHDAAPAIDSSHVTADAAPPLVNSSPPMTIITVPAIDGSPVTIALAPTSPLVTSGSPVTITAAAPAAVAANSLAKERKLQSMGHYKLW